MRALWLVLFCIAAIGCSDDNDVFGGARIDVMTSGLSAADVTRVELTVTAAGQTPIATTLVRNGNAWRGVLGQLPVGGQRVFAGRAYDAANTLVYEGQTDGVTITKNQTAVVTLILHEVSAPPPSENHAPRITYLYVSNDDAAPDEVITVRIGADDVDGDSLVTEWSTNGGTLGKPSGTQVTWRASTDGDYSITAKVTDAKGASDALVIALKVAATNGKGTASITASVNTFPRVSSILNTSGRLTGPGATLGLTAIAADPDADALTYAWTSDCAGVFSTPTLATTSFQLGPVAPPTCTFTATVSDPRMGEGSGQLVIERADDVTPQFNPIIDSQFQSSATLDHGGSVVLRVTGHSPQSGPVTIIWSEPTGLGSFSGQSGTTGSSEITWTAPDCFIASAMIDATVIDADNRATVAHFTMGPESAQCLGYTVGGDVAGLSGTVVLQNDTNGDGSADAELTLTSSGAFGFSGIAAGSPYAVTVKTQPLDQHCSVTNGSGTASGDVTDIEVTCANVYAVSGTIVGLEGSGLVLRNGTFEDLALPQYASSFTFTRKLASNTQYTVSVLAQPTNPHQTCTVLGGGTGTIGSSNVTNVLIDCKTNLYSVGGPIAGLVGTGLELVQATNGDRVRPPGGASAFAFMTKLMTGESYATQVATQPTFPLQECTVEPATRSGIVGSANVTNVGVTCKTTKLSIWVNVVNLPAGHRLQLDVPGFVTTTVEQNGIFQFSPLYVSGQRHRVIAGQPLSINTSMWPQSSHRCFVTDGSFTVGNTPPLVTVTCGPRVYNTTGQPQSATIPNTSGCSLLPDFFADQMDALDNGVIAVLLRCSGLRLAISTNGGASFNPPVSVLGVLPDSATLLSRSATEHLVLYARQGVIRFMRTVDGGTTWSDVMVGAPYISPTYGPALALVSSPTQLFAAWSASGNYTPFSMSGNNGASWNTISVGPIAGAPNLQPKLAFDETSGEPLLLVAANNGSSSLMRLGTPWTTDGVFTGNVWLNDFASGGGYVYASPGGTMTRVRTSKAAPFQVTSASGPSGTDYRSLDVDTNGNALAALTDGGGTVRVFRWGVSDAGQQHVFSLANVSGPPALAVIPNGSASAFAVRSGSNIVVGTVPH